MNLSSRDVAWILNQIGITLKRRSKEDVFAGYYRGKNRIVIVPRNKKHIPQGTLSSIWRQAGIKRGMAESIWHKREVESWFFYEISAEYPAFQSGDEC